MEKQKQQEFIDRISSLTGHAAMNEFGKLMREIGDDYSTLFAAHAQVHQQLDATAEESKNERGIVIWIHDNGRTRVEAFPLLGSMFNLVVCSLVYDNSCNLVWHRNIPNENMWLKPEQFDEWIANNV